METKGNERVQGTSRNELTVELTHSWSYSKLYKIDAIWKQASAIVCMVHCCREREFIIDSLALAAMNRAFFCIRMTISHSVSTMISFICAHTYERNATQLKQLHIERFCSHNFMAQWIFSSFFLKKKKARSNNTVCDAIARHKAFTYNSKSDDFTSRAFKATHSNPWLLRFQSNRCIQIAQQRHCTTGHGILATSKYQTTKMLKSSSWISSNETLHNDRILYSIIPKWIIECTFRWKKKQQNIRCFRSIFLGYCGEFSLKYFQGIFCVFFLKTIFLRAYCK